ncbi:ANTAR domain-containing response regulator, partial [Streptomyces albidoflavus]
MSVPEPESQPVSDGDVSHVPPLTTRVVIAEDEALIRLDLKEMLEEEGYSVVGEAGDGAKAVELAREHRPDLVILDVKMPVLDGISAAEKIAEESIAPVLMLTAFSQRDLVERARDAGAMAYLVKPFSKSDVVPAIEMAVSRFTELRTLEKEVEDLSQRLETRKLVDRAKSILQTQYGLTEPAAFRWIQKTSMDRRMSMRQVAEAVIEDDEEKRAAKGLQRDGREDDGEAREDGAGEQDVAGGAGAGEG